MYIYIIIYRLIYCIHTCILPVCCCHLWAYEEVLRVCVSRSDAFSIWMVLEHVTIEPLSSKMMQLSHPEVPSAPSVSCSPAAATGVSSTGAGRCSNPATAVGGEASLWSTAAASAEPLPFFGGEDSFQTTGVHGELQAGDCHSIMNLEESGRFSAFVTARWYSSGCAQRPASVWTKGSEGFEPGSDAEASLRGDSACNANFEEQCVPDLSR